MSDEEELIAGSVPFLLPDKEKGVIKMRATRHNERSGSHGTYNVKHNDRNFDVKNSNKIDAVGKRMKNFISVS